ncbi:MAG: histone deacetylase superfamily [Beijerinckiaceae bacterium]|nr:MAG: histone deacetylase superfamily [Beijerinckiaceae bacterium]
MTTLLISDPLFLDHSMPAGHPERPDRLRAVEKALNDSRFAGLLREGAAEGELDLAMLVHPEDYVREIAGHAPQEGLAFLDADTSMSPGSLPAVMAAMGSGRRAVGAVMSGEFANAFVAARPPGHHAMRETAMGFCLFNTMAVMARLAQKGGASRVAIVDWDVHHGNGTQDIFWADKDVLFVSSHEMPLYPGTGAKDERGEHGSIVNVPLRAGDDGVTFRDAFESIVFPRVIAHRPDIILISAGFDAHRRDPLGNLRLEARDYAWATERLMTIAAKMCGGRIVSLLEGGYDLEGLSTSVAAHVETLMGA